MKIHPRAATRRLNLGSLSIGGGAPVRVQSMTNTDTRDEERTVAQIHALRALGCEAVRIAVPDEMAASKVAAIVRSALIPVIADIHFDWRLAIKSMEAGVAGLRINPGNIGGEDKTARVIDCAKSNGVIIRIGVNSGSVPKEILARHGGPTPGALVESCMEYVRILEKHQFYNIKLSLKSSSVPNTIEAYRMASSLCDYPLHLGVTEAGTPRKGVIKSAVGIGALLAEGIGDTIRISLTASPEEEVTAAYDILGALELRRKGPEIISCPTCGRTEIDLIKLVNIVEKTLQDCEAPIKVAVMGCVVNGPGEAREADIGVAGGRGKGIIFRKGEIIRTERGETRLLEAFLAELDKLLGEAAACGSNPGDTPGNCA